MYPRPIYTYYCLACTSVCPWPYLFRALEAALLVRALSEGDLVWAAAELAVGALLVFVAAFTVRAVGGCLAI